jgi:hypothetical protein
MYSTVIFSLGLLVLSAFLVAGHVRRWRLIVARQSDAREIGFALAQLLRRAMASATLGLIGIALLASPRMVDPTRVSFWIYWGGVFLAIVVMGLLALVDMMRSRVYFRQVQAGLVEQLALEVSRKRSAHQGSADRRADA